MNKPIVTAVLIAVLFPGLSFARDLEGRVTRIENILENQRSSDMLLQIQRLQQEVQQLRGQVEKQQFELDNLKRQLSEHYTDLDGRLRGQDAGKPRETAGPTAPRPSQVPAQVVPPSAAPAGVEQTRAGSPSNLALPAPEGSQAVSEKAAYRDGFDLLKQRRYDAAVLAFEDLLERYPNGEFADNARYWLGETYYVKRDYAAALAQFRHVLSDHPLSAKVPGAMLKIGYIQDEQKDAAAARATLLELTQKFPDSTEARLAKGRLERIARDGR